MQPEHAQSVPVSEEPRTAGLTEVWRMSWPIIVGMASMTVMRFADEVMVARLGSEALAAAGVASLWIFVLQAFFMGVVTIVSTFVAQSFGKGAFRECASYAWQGIYMSVVMGGLALVLWPLSPVLVDLLPHEEAVKRLELQYFQVSIAAYFFMAWTFALQSFFTAVSHPRIPMYAGVFCNFVNILLNYLLIFGHGGLPRLEIRGAALATVLSIALNAVILLGFFLHRRFHSEFGTRTSWRFDRTKLLDMFRVGWPNGATLFLDVFNWGIFTSIFVASSGTVALAAHAIAMNFLHVSFMPALGLNQGISNVVGQWIGRGDIARAKARTYTAIKMAASYMIFMGALMAVFGRELITLFFSREPEVVRFGHVLLCFAAAFQAFDAVNIICFGSLKGAGDTRWTALMMFVMNYGFFMPLGAALVYLFDLGALGAWIAATVYIILLSGVVLWRWRSERWRDIRIFSSDRHETPADAPPEAVPQTAGPGGDGA
jgi:MATE family multidrug resistance protein